MPVEKKELVLTEKQRAKLIEAFMAFIAIDVNLFDKEDVESVLKRLKMLRELPVGGKIEKVIYGWRWHEPKVKAKPKGKTKT